MKLRRPGFWVLLSVVSILCVQFSLRYFPEAFPLVNLDIQMDRSGALSRARSLAETSGWGPGNFRQAASFGVMTEVQNFVELEGGGKPAFNRMLESELFSPYTWVVRHFAERETTETAIRFTPAGLPYGFQEKLPEDQPGETLLPDAARSLAEDQAVEQWSVDLGSYTLVEQSQEVRPSGRTDHSFVYEHSSRDIGDARCRLRLVVSGSRFTQLSRFVKIPEAFQRRYEEMRSANNTIGMVGTFAMGLLYVLGGCVIGLFFLLRQGWVQWRPALWWGAFISLLQGLVIFNQLPLAWMGYDTALSGYSFLLQQSVLALLQVVGFGILFALSFMAAESLSRRAFPHHVQLWGAWSSGVANSTSVLGQTLGGYLVVPVFFAFEVVLYFASHRFWGWWTPSNALFQPNVLADYFPWFSPIALSLQAGFWEECLFRAVPLAGAALLGQRFGGRKTWIGVALVIQALIFGAGHAPYPTQPAYARMVELMLPSFLFGFLFLRFGLLPAIVLHFSYDVVWFAMPLFVSTAPGIWLERCAVIVLTLVPAWIVLRGRWRGGRWAELSDRDRNTGWQPPRAQETAAETLEQGPESMPGPTELPASRKRVIAIAGLLALGLWVATADFGSDAPALGVRRDQAIGIAKHALSERNLDASGWRELATVQEGLDVADRFIWQSAGEDTYRTLLGSYLDSPRWKIRFARFDGDDVQERAEEFLVYVDTSTKAVRVRHQLPEVRSGQVLDQATARKIALATIREKGGLSADRLRKVSAEPVKLPNRQDWTFTFADPDPLLPEGETRVSVEIAGEQVVDFYRGVHVPEDWLRTDRSHRTMRQIVQILSALVLVLIVIAGAVVAIVSWSRKQFSVPTFLAFAALVLCIQTFASWNSWQATAAAFSTAQPLGDQILTELGSAAVGALFLALLLGLIMGWLHRSNAALGTGAQPSTRNRLETIWFGLSLGVAFAFLGRMASLMNTAADPTWASYGALEDYFPSMSPLLGSLATYLLTTIVLLLFFSGVNNFTGAWSRKKRVGTLLILVAGLVFRGIVAETLLPWISGGILLGAGLWLAYIFVLRFDLNLIPMASCGLIGLDRVQQGLYQAYPGSLFGESLAVLGLMVLAVLWSRVR